MANLNNYPVLRGLNSKIMSNLKIVCVFGVNGNEVLLVTKDDKVYAFGENRNGCLGLSTFNRIVEPTKVDILCNKGINKLSYGLCHVMALTSGGEVYSWGDNNYGQCCNGSKDKSTPSMKRQNSGYNCPKLINDWLKKPIADISCGAFHTLILTQTSELYAVGYNRFGQIGNGYNCDQFTPIKITLNSFESEKIVSITCGYYHSMALTQNGRVYSWGKNNFGQLGIEPTDDNISIGSIKSLNRSLSNNNYCHQIPTRISGLEGVIVRKIISGSNHNLLLTTDGEIYAFGDNSFGQIGSGNESRTQNVAIKIYNEENLKFTDIAASFYSHISIAVSSNGKHYIWGECGGEVVTIPTEIATTDISIHDLFAVYSKPQITYKAITYFDKLSVEESIHKSFDNQNHSDLKIIIDKKFIFVHKCILRIRCDYFNHLLDKKLEEIEDNIEVLRIDSYSYDVYYSFLKYLYTDFVDIKPEDAIDLYDLANSYFEEDLKQKCLALIKKNTTALNVYHFYSNAFRINARDLQEFCYAFALKNYRILDPETKLKFNFSVS
jgi:RCC1 and BTB domain-containing protein